jgi:hypothetical protein
MPGTRPPSRDPARSPQHQPTCSPTARDATSVRGAASIPETANAADSPDYRRRLTPALVVSDQCMFARQRLAPVAPDRTLRVVLEVAQPVGGLDERRAAPAGGIGDPRAVGGGAEADHLLEGGTHAAVQEVRTATDLPPGRSVPQGRPGERPAGWLLRRPAPIFSPLSHIHGARVPSVPIRDSSTTGYAWRSWTMTAKLRAGVVAAQHPIQAPGER